MKLRLEKVVCEVILYIQRWPNQAALNESRVQLRERGVLLAFISHTVIFKIGKRSLPWLHTTITSSLKHSATDSASENTTISQSNLSIHSRQSFFRMTTGLPSDRPLSAISESPCSYRRVFVNSIISGLCLRKAPLWGPSHLRKYLSQEVYGFCCGLSQRNSGDSTWYGGRAQGRRFLFTVWAILDELYWNVNGWITYLFSTSSRRRNHDYHMGHLEIRRRPDNYVLHKISMNCV